MKIVAIGDPHIKSDNVVEFSLFEERLHNLLDEVKPDFVVVLGDVLHHHEKLYTTSLNNATSFIKKIGDKYKTFVLVGNHDMINNQQFLTENHWMNSIKLWGENIVIIDKVVRYQDFILCPYVSPGRFEEALNTIGNWKNASLIFAHQEFKGCKMGAIISEHGDTWDESLPMVVSGHIHLNQWVGKNVYYPGSALQHAFGESERNIIPIITKNKQWDITEKDLDLPRKKIITVNIEKAEKIEIQDDKKDQIKLSVTGDIHEFKSFKKSEKYKSLVDKGIKVVFKPKEIKNVDSVSQGEIQPFDTVLRELILKEKDNDLLEIYERFVNNRDIIIL
jgi:DNA repair exonuclease SbcCD nuclease subunit